MRKPGRRGAALGRDIDGGPVRGGGRVWWDRVDGNGGDRRDPHTTTAVAVAVAVLYLALARK